MRTNGRALKTKMEVFSSQFATLFIITLTSLPLRVHPLGQSSTQAKIDQDRVESFVSDSAEQLVSLSAAASSGGGGGNFQGLFGHFSAAAAA